MVHVPIVHENCDSLARRIEQGSDFGLEQILPGDRDRYENAIVCPKKSVEECLTCLKLPESDRKRVRTTNGVERLIEEAQRRTNAIGPMAGETARFSLVYAVLVDAAKALARHHHHAGRSGRKRRSAGIGCSDGGECVEGRLRGNHPTPFTERMERHRPARPRETLPSEAVVSRVTGFPLTTGILGAS